MYSRFCAMEGDADVFGCATEAGSSLGCEWKIWVRVEDVQFVFDDVRLETDPDRLCEWKHAWHESANGRSTCTMNC